MLSKNRSQMSDWLIDIIIYKLTDSISSSRERRGGCGSVGTVKGPFDVCRRLNAPPAAPAPLIISNFPVIYYLYRYLFVQFHGRCVSHLASFDALHAYNAKLNHFVNFFYNFFHKGNKYDGPSSRIFVRYAVAVIDGQVMLVNTCTHYATVGNQSKRLKRISIVGLTWFSNPTLTGWFVLIDRWESNSWLCGNFCFSSYVLGSTKMCRKYSRARVVLHSVVKCAGSLARLCDLDVAFVLQSPLEAEFGKRKSRFACLNTPPFFWVNFLFRQSEMYTFFLN